MAPSPRVQTRGCCWTASDPPRPRPLSQPVPATARYPARPGQPLQPPRAFLQHQPCLEDSKPRPGPARLEAGSARSQRSAGCRPGACKRMRRRRALQPGHAGGCPGLQLSPPVPRTGRDTVPTPSHPDPPLLGPGSWKQCITVTLSSAGLFPELHLALACKEEPGHPAFP